MVPAFFKVSFRRFLTLLAAYFVFRVLFLIWNWSLYRSVGASELAQAFVLGLRFDTAAILMTNAILFLLWMLPSRWLAQGWFRRLDLGLFAVLNLLCFGVSIADAEFIKFMGKRSSYDLLFLHEDVERQSFSILSTYWYFVCAWLMFTALVVWFLPRFSKEAPREIWWQGMLWRLGATGLIFVGVRGGFGFKPINPMEAYFSTKHELGLLVLNTPLNLIKTRPNGKIERARYFNSDKEAIDRLHAMTDLSRPPLGLARKWNVVVLIVESFSSEYVGVANDWPGYTPFFDSLSKKALYFKYNFANARRSIEGLPAVICGLPAIMEEPIITSDFSSNRLDCMPKMLAQQGYSTYFLHGAHNGSMHFDSFSRLAGFENFIGLNEYPKDNPEDFDKYWGVLDEPMLQYAIKKIDEAPKPTMLSVFTLSSHHPYYIPPKYAGKFPKGELEIHESIGYADYSLEQFFKVAETKPWFKNTIFIITADHTQKSVHPEIYYDWIGYYRVPLLFYIPGLDMAKLGVARDRITQQIDVMPSVMDLLGIELPERLLVGQSVFDSAKPGRAYNATTYSYWLIEPKLVVEMLRDQKVNFYTHSNTYARTPAVPNEKAQESALDLKAVVHYLNEGLVGNSLYRWKDAR